MQIHPHKNQNLNVFNKPSIEVHLGSLHAMCLKELNWGSYILENYHKFTLG